MNDQGLDIRHIRQQRKELQAFAELAGGLRPTTNAKGEDRARPFREIAIIEFLLPSAGQRGMVDLLNLLMIFQEVHNLERVFHMPLHTQ